MGGDWDRVSFGSWDTGVQVRAWGSTKVDEAWDIVVVHGRVATSGLYLGVCQGDTGSTSGIVGGVILILVVLVLNGSLLDLGPVGLFLHWVVSVDLFKEELVVVGFHIKLFDVAAVIKGGLLVQCVVLGVRVVNVHGVVGVSRLPAGGGLAFFNCGEVVIDLGQFVVEDVGEVLKPRCHHLHDVIQLGGGTGL